MICFSWFIHILRVVVLKKGISHATTQRRQTSTTATTVLSTAATVRPTIPAATNVSATSTKEEEQGLALDCPWCAGRSAARMHRHRGSDHIRCQNDKHWHYLFFHFIRQYAQFYQ